MPRATPLFEEDGHVYRHPVSKQRLPALTSVLAAAGFGSNWWPDEQALLRGRRVHAACHFDDEGDLNLDTVLESDRGYLEAWREAKDFYKIRSKAIEQLCMLDPPGICCRPDLIGTGVINGVRLPLVVERKTGNCPKHVRYQLAGQQMMQKDPYRFVRLAIELHADGTWKAVGPWFPSTFAADRRVVEAALAIYRAKEGL